MEVTDREQWLDKQAAAVAREEGCELLELKIHRRGERSVVALTVDRAGGVSVEDCARVSRRLEAVLDQQQPFEHAYVLEVSSPGLDRKLESPREYLHFRGRQVRVETRQPVTGRHQFRGRLLGLDSERGMLRLETAPEVVIELPFEQVAWTRLDFALPGSDRRRPRRRGVS